MSAVKCRQLSTSFTEKALAFKDRVNKANTCPRKAKWNVELLGNCFWREGLEAAFGAEWRGEKGGCVGKGTSMRTSNWAYMKYGDGSEELYDMKKDSKQFVNLAKSTQHAKVLQSLRQQFQSVRKQ